MMTDFCVVGLYGYEDYTPLGVVDDFTIARAMLAICPFNTALVNGKRLGSRYLRRGRWITSGGLFPRCPISFRDLALVE